MNLISSSLALFLSLIVSWPVFAQDGCSATNIVLPLRIPTKALEDMLNRDIPNQMSGREDINISGVKGERLWWTMSRSPLKLATNNDRLSAETTISGKVRVRGEIRPFGPDFSVGPNLEATASLSIGPVLKNDWSLDPNAEASAKVKKADIEIPVLGSISIRTQSQRAASKLMERTAERINEKFKKNEFLRKEGQKLWKDLPLPKRLSDKPPMWLVIKPTQIGATNLIINDNSVDFGISVSAETNLVLEPPPIQEELPDQGELPSLEILDELPKEKIELALPIFSDWETLNDLMTDSLAKNPVGYEGSSGSLTFTNIEFEARPEESVLISAVISVEPTERIGRMLHSIRDGLRAVGLPFRWLAVEQNQTVKMSVKPAVSEDGKSIVLKNAKLMPDSSDLVKTLAGTYSWLTDETVEAVIERHAVADLSTRLAELEQKGQAIVNEFTEKLEESGFSLNVKIQPVTRFSFVEVHPEGLVAKVCAAADAKAEIRSFEFQ